MSTISVTVNGKTQHSEVEPRTLLVHYLRDALGLTKGSVLKVELEGSRIVLSKHVDDAISRVRGKFALDAGSEPAKAKG